MEMDLMEGSDLEEFAYEEDEWDGEEAFEEDEFEGEEDDFEEDEFGEEDFEFEADAPATVTPAGKEAVKKKMAVLADCAAKAKTQKEADEFLAALAPLAASLLPSAISIGRKVLPGLVRGAVRTGRSLVRSLGRSAVRATPRIVRHATYRTLRRHAAGRPVNVNTVSRDLAYATARTMRSPSYMRRCVADCRRRAARARRSRTHRYR